MQDKLTFMFHDCAARLSPQVLIRLFAEVDQEAVRAVLDAQDPPAEEAVQ